MQGQLKSRVQCPKCNRVSIRSNLFCVPILWSFCWIYFVAVDLITFDPVMYLSLPLRREMTKRMFVYYRRCASRSITEHSRSRRTGLRDRRRWLWISSRPRDLMSSATVIRECKVIWRHSALSNQTGWLSVKYCEWSLSEEAVCKEYSKGPMLEVIGGK